MDQSPYQAPSTDHLAKPSDPYFPKVLSTQGRIGRARYLCYSIWLSFAIMFFGSMIGGAVAVFFSGMNEAQVMSFAFVIGLGLYLPIFLLFFVLAKRRLNDVDMSGWLSLLIFVPFINFIFAMLLVVWPGTEGENRFGPPPAENSLAVVIFGIVLPTIGFLLVLLGLFLPLLLGDTSWLGNVFAELA